MGDSSDLPKDTVVVTGFGPFGNHVINASWVAVQELEKLGLGDDVNLIVQEIPVEYVAVKSLVPTLWAQFRPKLMVHVGVSGIAKMITLEQQAHNDGYDKLDVKGCLPLTHCCIDDAPRCLHSHIDMNKVCDYVNRSQCGVEAIVSHDPGRYLCDYTYFLSLHEDCSCSAFIHVPPLHKPYSGLQLGRGLRQCVRAMLTQLNAASPCAHHRNQLSSEQSTQQAELLSGPPTAAATVGQRSAADVGQSSTAAAEIVGQPIQESNTETIS